MKLMSYSLAGRETWGVVIADGVAELAALTGYATLADFIASPDFARRDALTDGLAADAKLADVTFLPVIPRPEKIVCAVRNYMDHHQEVLAAGMQRELSEEPPIFLRVWRSQTAHQGPIVRPHVSDSLDWEESLPSSLARAAGTSPRRMPGSTLLAIAATTMRACGNGSSMPNRLHRARISSPPAPSVPGW